MPQQSQTTRTNPSKILPNRTGNTETFFLTILTSFDYYDSDYIQGHIYIYIYIHLLYPFTYIYVCFAASAASPATAHPSRKEAAFGRLHDSGAGTFGARPSIVDSFMDGCVGAGEAADAAKHK